MKKKDFLQLAEKHATGNCSEEEKEIVEHFYEKLQNRDISPSWQFTQEENLRLKILLKILQRTEDYEKSKAERYINIYKLAASVIILIGLGISFFYYLENSQNVEQLKYTTVTTSDSQRKKITLSDGSEIKLNFGSSLSYPDKFSESDRVVVLKGEAFFEVEKDKSRPFIINSGRIKTQVLGTSFNIKAYPKEDLDVTVVSGKVKVSTEDDSLILISKQQAQLKQNGEKLILNEVDTILYAGWKNGNIDFEMISVKEVFEKLSRWYHIEFDIEKEILFDDDCLIRANYKNESIESILKSLQNVIDFEYEVKGQKNISIIYKGCIN